MEKNEFRTVIKHFYIKGNIPKEIKVELDKVHGRFAPSFKTEYNGVNEFKRDRTSNRVEPHSERPVEAATPEIIEKVYDMILNVRRVKAQ